MIRRGELIQQMRIGVDTGGTFTDCVVFGRGRVRVLKLFSTPANSALAIQNGVRRILSDLATSDGELAVLHGTTVGTNSLIERRGARVGLVTTKGFEDILEIGRQARPRLYDLNVRRQPPLVPRELRWGLAERITVGGQVLQAPAKEEFQRLKSLARRYRVDSLAVCLLFSYANPSHERAVRDALGPLGIPISVSHEILPEFREYERLSTVVINAFLAPRMGAYLDSLERGVAKLAGSLVKPSGVRPPARRKATTGRVQVMQSSGGLTTAGRAAHEPVRTILSGPAGGVVATAWLSGVAGVRQSISFDMGGTSTDVCLIDGQPRTTRETTLCGLPVAVPVLDVHSVGAGGGSIARLDTGGALRVGPESSGADPGPACYDRGGVETTVSDANLLLGRLDPQHFLGGTFSLNADRAEKACNDFLRRYPRRQLERSGLRSPLDLACGIIQVSNATMEKALRVISVERGYDARDFTLVCFGGAGGVHAAELSTLLGIRQVIVPPNPGAFSALGILISDVVKDVSHSLLQPVPQGMTTSQRARFFSTLEKEYRALEKRGRHDLRAEGFSPNLARAEYRVELRYVGQSYELAVPFSRQFAAAFHQAHEQAYGYAHPGRPLEVVTLRVRLIIPTPKPIMRRTRLHASRRPAQPLGTKPVWFPGGFRATPLFERSELAPGDHFTGPAVIFEYSSTSVVPPAFECQVDAYMNLVLRPSVPPGR